MLVYPPQGDFMWLRQLIELKTYSDTDEWEVFRNVFTLMIHDVISMPDRTKMQYF